MNHMMPTFTSGPNAATPPGCGSDASSLVPNHFNENIDPNNDNNACRTPLSSPMKHLSPTTPQPSDRSTSLRRRYLAEVAMSPATPPRTPSPTKGRVSPSKRADSPTKGRDSPTKQKLEIGQNGFYFSCELPMSKITPKKVDAGVMTPTRRKPSPSKTGSVRREAMSRDSSPVEQTPSKGTSTEKQTPLKALRHPPLKERTPRKALKEASAVTASSATKNGLPKMSVVANSLSHTSVQSATTSNPPKQTKSVKKSPAKSIGCAPRLLQGAFTPSPAHPMTPAVAKAGLNGEATSVDQVAPAAPQSAKQPRPLLNATGKTPTKPTRGASFDIGDLMAGLKSDVTRPRSATAEQVVDTNVCGSPTTLQKAAEKLQLLAPAAKRGTEPASPVKNMIKESPLNTAADIPALSRIPIPFKIKDQTLQYRPVSFPSPVTKSDTRPKVTPSPWEKHVKFQDSAPSPKPRRLSLPKIPRRAGTDPTVLLAMQQEMNTLQSLLSTSLGVNFRFSGRENTFELPAMASSLLESDNQATPSRTRLRYIRTLSDLSNKSNTTKFSTSTMRVGVPMHPKQNAPTSPNKRMLPKCPSVGNMLQKTRTDKPAVSKEKDVTERAPKVANTPKRLTAQSATAAFSSSSRATTNKPSTPHSKGVITSTRSTPARPRTTPKPATIHSTLSATPSKAQSSGISIPQGARKSIFDPPASATATSTPKPRPATLRPDAKLCTTPRPVFASATDIADRIAEWNSKDRVRTLAKPRFCAANTPSKLPTIPAKPTKNKESYTPPGSPSKPPATTAKSLVPKRAAPKPPLTPKLSNPALARLRGPGLPRTPVGRNKGGEQDDPNAFRTPSKEIESSLDRAIDAKIEEDRRGGRELRL